MARTARSRRRAPAAPACATATVPGDGSVRGRILDAAVAAFMERGYAGTSTLEIATRAKVSKREVYAHFGSKQAMLVACITHGVQLMRLPLELPEARDRSGLTAMLTAFGANFLRVILGPRVVALYRLAVAEAERSPEVARALDTTGRGGARAALAATLVRAQAAGLIGAGDAMDMTRQYFSLLLGDWHLRVLLGVIPKPAVREIEDRARTTTDVLQAIHPPAS